MVNDYDLLIVGAGPTGLACAIAGGRAGLKCVVLEKGCLVNSIYNYPTNMVFFTTTELLEIGNVPMTSASIKPTRLEAMEYYRKVASHFELNVHTYERVDSVERLEDGFRVRSTKMGGAPQEYRAQFVVLATGYYDIPNQLGVPGEELPHVFHYYKEAHPFAGHKVVVLGGKNSSVDAALDLWRHGADVTLVYRGKELSPSIKYWVRPDIENRIKAGEIKALFQTTVLAIESNQVLVRNIASGAESELRADFVFALIGYRPDFEFLRSAGVEYDPKSGRPLINLETFETNVPGLYLGGVVVAGPYTGEIFIENGRFHGQVIVDDVVRKKVDS